MVILMQKISIVCSKSSYQNLINIPIISHFENFVEVLFVENLETIHNNFSSAKIDTLLVGDLGHRSFFHELYSLFEQCRLIYIPFIVYEGNKDFLCKLDNSDKSKIFVYFEWHYTNYAKNVSDLFKTGSFGSSGLNRIHLWLHKNYCQLILSRTNLFKLVDLVNFVSVANVKRYLLMQSSLVNNYIQLHCLHTDDSTTLISNFVSDSQIDNYFSLSMIGSDGAIYADDHYNSHLAVSNNNSSFVIQSPFHEYNLSDIFIELLSFSNANNSHIFPLIELPSLEDNLFALKI